MNLNEKHFNTGFITATLGVIFYLIAGGTVDPNTVIGMLGGISFNVALFLATVFGLQYYQLGTGRDIQKEIFDEANLAAAVYEAGLFIAIALVISKGIM